MDVESPVQTIAAEILLVCSISMSYTCVTLVFVRRATPVLTKKHIYSYVIVRAIMGGCCIMCPLSSISQYTNEISNAEKASIGTIGALWNWLRGYGIFFILCMAIIGQYFQISSEEHWQLMLPVYCMYLRSSHIARVRINRVRLPILLVVS